MLASKLSPGDVVGIVAPSAPINASDEKFHNGIEAISEMGFAVEIGEHVFSKALGHCASPEDKGEDINYMFSEPGIKAIVCAQGGQTSNDCLPFIDWDLVKSNPKIFIGMSDITVLCNAFHTMTGLVTFHGNDLMWGLGWNPSEYDLTEFNKMLIKGEASRISPNGPRVCLRDGVGEGPLLGGHPGCLLKLAGTPFFPDFTGAVLFLETFGNSPEEVHSNLSQLKQLGVFSNLNGLLLGNVLGRDTVGNVEPEIIKVIMLLLKEFSFPVLKVSDFGHCCSNTYLPLGTKTRLNCIEKEVTYLEPFLTAAVEIA